MKQQTIDIAAKACVYLIDAADMIRQDTHQTVASDDHIEIIRHYAKLRQINEQIKEAREALDEMEKRLSREQVPGTMRSHGIKTITVEGVGRVSLSNRWSASMLDKAMGFQWLRDTGNGALIIETVNAQTLAAFAKDLNDNQGKELPAEIFNVGIMTVTSITKA